MRFLFSCLLLGTLLPGVPAAAQSAGADTLAATPATLPAAARPDSTLPALRGLAGKERFALGQAHARQHFRPSKGIFWGGVGIGASSTVLTVPLGAFATLGGVGGTVALGLKRPQPGPVHASAPQPELLRDADYQRGYEHAARMRKLGKSVAGYAVGSTVVALPALVLVAVVVVRALDR